MQNGDEVLPSISPAGHGQYVKMLITLEPLGVFCTKFAYLYILTLSCHRYAKQEQGFAEHPSGRSWLVSGKHL